MRVMKNISIRFGFVLAGLFAVAFLFGCLQNGNSKPPIPVDTSNAVTKAMCEQYRGIWNVQGQCACGAIAGFQCPPGFVCGDYVPSATTPDAIGVCKKVSE